MQNIFFIGLMGAGKTTIGRLIAKHIGAQFFDADHEIEKKTGVKIPLIFELEGEAGFRKRESATIAELCQKQAIVLATGGGAVLLPENRTQLKTHGHVIYLRAQVDDLWVRTRYDRSRPLLQGGNLRQKLEQLYADRNPIYTELADIIVDTGTQSAAEITQQILEILKVKFNMQTAEKPSKKFYLSPAMQPNAQQKNNNPKKNKPILKSK